ncbi:MAG: TAXI family TRAP transporter solute-binding subunit [Rhodospirillaceae bacterium]
MEKKVQICTAFAGVASAAMIITSGTALAASKPDIRISTGRQGGAYYNMAAVVADALYRSGQVKSATAESSSGGPENMRLLTKGTVQIGATDMVWSVKARNGEKPYKQKHDIYTVAPLGQWPLFFVTPAGSKIKTIDDLKGKRVAVGARGSGMENHTRLILGAAGLSFKDIKPIYLSFRPGARAVKDGKAEAQFQCCVPNPALTELSELSRVRGVELGSAKSKILALPVYGEMTLKKGAFKGQPRDIPAIADVNAWYAHKSLSNDIAYLYAKTIIENYKAFAKKMPQFSTVADIHAKVKTAGVKALEIGAPLHPGAMKAYKEAGILK